MRSIVMTALGLAITVSFGAAAQPTSPTRGTPTGLGSQPADAGRQAPMGASGLPEPRSALPASVGGFVPPGQRPPRPETAIGPDLAAYLFAPIEGMVGPITEGLHAFDAAIAPINEALQPVTGPYGAALEVAPETAPPPSGTASAPTAANPRK
jgi:hypothetical protein